MADNIGIKIGVDGEREFKSALASINSQMKVLGSELKLVESQFSSQDHSVEALTARNQALTKSIEGQKQKIELLEKALKNSATSFGTNDKRTLEWQRQLNEAKAALNKMEHEVQENNQVLNKNEKEFKEAGKAADNYGDEVKESGDKSKTAGEAFKGLGSACKAVGVAVAAAAAAVSAAAIAAGKALINMTKEGAKYSDEVLTQSQITGIATDKLQEYMYAAELVDVSVDTLTGSMAKNIKSMKSAAAGSSSFAEAYAKLGVEVTNADGTLRNSEDVYWELIDALGMVENETERDSLAMTLLGRSAQDLNPLIEAGAGRLAQLGEEARDAGYVLSGDLLNAYGEYDDAMQRFTNGTKAAKNALGTILLPVLTDLTSEGTRMLGEFSNAILDCGGDLSKLPELFDRFLPEVLDVISSYIPTILTLIGTLLKNVGTTILNNMPYILSTVSEILGQVLTALLKAIPKALDSMVEFLLSVAETLLANLPLLISAVKQIIISIEEQIINAGPTLMTVFQGIISEMVGLIKELVPMLIQMITSALENIVGSIEGYLDTILSALIDIIESLVNAILDGLPALLSAVIAVLEKVLSAVLNFIPKLLQSLANMIPQIIKTVLSLIPQLIEAILNIVLAIVAELPTIIESIIAMIDEIIVGVVDAVVEALPLIIDAVFKLVLGIVGALPDIINTLITSIPEIISHVISTLISLIPELVQCAIALVEGILTHLPEIIVGLIKAIPEIIANLVSGFMDGISDFFTIGVELIKGLWEGIKSMFSWLWDKVSGFCSGLWNGIKDFFGIHSPSTKFAEIGENLGLGLGEGFVDSMKGVESDIENAIPTDFDIDARTHLKNVAYDQISPNTIKAKENTQSEFETANSYDTEQIILLREQNSLLRRILEKELSIFVGDDEIGRANARYEEKRGVKVNEGGFQNAY